MNPQSILLNFFPSVYIKLFDLRFITIFGNFLLTSQTYQHIVPIISRLVMSQTKMHQHIDFPIDFSDNISSLAIDEKSPFSKLIF